ncbi:MAG TPA: LuxR C-terminal-related transcriptional regulator [Candidatus Saccharimonadia bacterium]|nr:LuxR C-terminal-related transcriptional regulator [Candidatus Saccharimonadia bacterium]
MLSVLKGLGVTARDTHLRVLRETLDNHPHYLGVWAVWEPDALDGNDETFCNATSHDVTGRFKPWWHRRFGEPQFEVSQDCDDPVLGCYYQQPVLKRAPVIVAPYQYPMGDGPALLATAAAPIMLGDQCLGAAGVDFALDSLAKDVASRSASVAKSLVDLVASELDVGLVFVDEKQRSMAWSSSASELLHGFSIRPLQAGQVLPVELRSNDVNQSASMSEVLITQRGTTIRAARLRPLHGEPAVIVLTKSVAVMETPPLSAREDEVMRWLSEGKSNEEIGIILSISPHTVKNHLDRIYRKIGVDNRHAATLSWFRSKALHGMLPTPF